MTWLRVIRLIVLAITSLCATAVLLSASYLTTTSSTILLFNAGKLSIAVGALTIPSIITMLVVDFYRTGAFTSLVIVELSWLCTYLQPIAVLWVLWLAETIVVGTQEKVLLKICGYSDIRNSDEPVLVLVDEGCIQVRVIIVFAVLASVALLVYISTLLVVALINSARGSPMWTSSVKEMPSLVPLPSKPTQMSTTTQYQVLSPDERLPNTMAAPAILAITVPPIQSMYPQV
ncbi:hypothetical protein C8Q73DRAFT_665630 [Cubamyces lactineus]|nr:hypothetical protein C8Q73DRAFT_665630 [Cubamyces lactineus]